MTKKTPNAAEVRAVKWIWSHGKHSLEADLWKKQVTTIQVFLEHGKQAYQLIPSKHCREFVSRRRNFTFISSIEVKMERIHVN